MENCAQEIFLSETLQNAEISLLMTEGIQELLSYQSNLPLIPASNTKLFVSAAALLSEKKATLFPPLQTFAHGPVDQGVLNGNLILDSCGSLIFSVRFPDHNNFEVKNQLLSEQVRRYAEQLRSSGVTTIRGNIKLSFERWNAPPENTHYTSASAFSFNENTVALVEDGVLKTVPDSPAVFKFESTHEVETQGVTNINKIRYNKEANSRDFWRISNVSATEYALSMLKQELRKQGIKILEQVLEPKADKKLLFETANTLEIAEFINPLNTYSDNFRAELLALLLARSNKGKASYSYINKTIHNIFEEFNLSLESLQIEDGSGLSRKNRVSASDIVKLLQFMEKLALFEPFKDSMPLAGRTGTLENRFKGTLHGKAAFTEKPEL